MTPFGATVLFGPPTGVFGITSLTFTNFDGIAHNVTLFVTQSLPPSGLCAGDDSNATGDGSGPSTTLIVPPRSTLHLAYPMPMVVNPVQGIPCIPVAGTVTIISTGYASGGVDPYFTLFRDVGAGAVVFVASNYVQAFSTGGDFAYATALSAGS